MSKTIEIIGKAFYKNVGMGAWGILDQSGTEFRPINMPDQLKNNQGEVRCIAVHVDEDVSMHMWGTPVKIISFHT
jgi:hypothetical protein